MEMLNAPGVEEPQRRSLVLLLTMIFHGQPQELRQAAADYLQAAANTSDQDPASGPAIMVKVFRG